MPTMLDVRSLLRSRREQKAGDVFALARQLSRDESVDPDVLAAAVAAAGMDEDALVDLVDLLRRRDECRAKAATLATAERELASVRGAISRQREALEEAEKRYRRAVEPLIAQEEAAADKVKQATAAASALLSQQNLPRVIVERIEAAKGRVHQAESTLREAEQEQARQRRRVEDGLMVLEPLGGFDKHNAKYESPTGRELMTADALAAVEDVRGGRHRISVAEEKLLELRRERDAAKADYDNVMREAKEF